MPTKPPHNGDMTAKSVNISEAAKIISSALFSAPIIVAIDGRCASGKTTLAKEIESLISGLNAVSGGEGRYKNNGCALTVIHTDDFFLRPEQRSPERLRTPGENIDHERFLKEVLIPLKEEHDFSYRPFNCHTYSFGEPIFVKGGKKSVLIEGSYSCHRNLCNYYDMRIFLSTDKKTQYERIRARNGANAEIFVNKWIPLEELYFSFFHVPECCELIVEI